MLSKLSPSQSKASKKSTGDRIVTQGPGWRQPQHVADSLAEAALGQCRCRRAQGRISATIGADCSARRVAAPSQPRGTACPPP
jgi:hypothetical protein